MLTIGVSVPLAFGGVLILLAYSGGYDPSGFFATGHWKMNSVILLAIPLFIMAGDIMQRGKIAKPIVEIAELLFGHLRGGLSAASVSSQWDVWCNLGQWCRHTDLHRLDHHAASAKGAVS